MSNNEPASTSQNLSVPFYERRKVGRALGALLGLSAIAPLYWFASKGQPGLGAVVAMVPVGAGIWLFQKPYLKDPEALKEYREEYDKLTLVEGVKNHGWTIDYLQNFVSHDEIRRKFLAEVGTGHGLRKIWDSYGELFMREITKQNLISGTYFEEQFYLDASNSKTALAGNVSLIEHLNAFGIWLVDDAHVNPSVISAALDKVVACPPSVYLIRKDPKTHAMTFDQLVKHGVQKLLDRKLVSPRLCYVPCKNELEKVGFGVMVKKYGKWWVDEKILTLQEVSHHFRLELHAMDNVIELLNLYWEWPIRKHGADIEVNVDELDMLRELKNKHSLAQENYEMKKKSINDAFDSAKENEMKRVVHEAISKYSARLKELGRLHPTGSQRYNDEKEFLDQEKKDAVFHAKLAERSAVTTAATKKSNDEAALRANWNAVLDQINSNWRRFVKGEPLLDIHVSDAGSTDTSRVPRGSNSPSINVNVNVSSPSASPTPQYQSNYPSYGSPSSQPQPYQPQSSPYPQSNSFDASAPPQGH